MSVSARLKIALETCISLLHPEVVVETGTYHGDGSTRAVIAAFGDSPPARFDTIEASWQHFQIAKNGLAQHPFVTVHYGLSVTRTDALDFMGTDAYVVGDVPAGLAVDSPDPWSFYLRELDGLGTADRRARQRPEGLLARLLQQCRDRRPLIVLDSAGGLGWLEYQQVLRTQQDRPFGLVLDDIAHVKHYRSALAVGSDPGFIVVDYEPHDGWLVAVRDVNAGA